MVLFPSIYCVVAFPQLSLKNCEGERALILLEQEVPELLPTVSCQRQVKGVKGQQV